MDLGPTSTESLDQSRLADTKPQRIAEYKKRKQAFDFQTVHRAMVQDEIDKGWEYERTLKSGIKLRRPKTHDVVLENKVWTILYLLGFSRLNVGRQFKLTIKIDRKEATKQIDVVGIDDDTVVICECKSAETYSSKSMSTALSELDSLKRPIANAVRALLGDDENRKFIWCLTTANIRWREQDLLRAKEKRIHVLRERELRYFFEIAKSLGPAARHQFEAEFLAGQKISTMANRRVPASRFKLGGRNAYSFTVPTSELVRRSFVNHRDLRDPSGAPTYQRLISKRRIVAIAEFLKSGGFFANSIIINFHKSARFEQIGKDDESDTRFGYLYLPDTYKSCWIIDGQHRLYGAALIDDDSIDPVIPVVAFEKLPPEREANLFTTINREQKQVPRRLLDELEGELQWNADDPEKAMKAVAARALDQVAQEVSGPFEDRIASAGIQAEAAQNLTLPQIKNALVKSGLLGRKLPKNRGFSPGPLSGSSSEAALGNTTDFINHYFSALRAANSRRWDMASKGLLSYNPAIQAYFRLIGELVSHLQTKHKIDPFQLESQELAEKIVSLCEPLFKFVGEASDEEFKDRFYVPFGSGGPARYFYNAAELIHKEDPQFAPEGLLEHLAGSDQETKEECAQLVSWISDRVHEHVVEVLRSNYGDQFFNLGIQDKAIKKKAFEKSLDDPEGAKPLETYLDVIELKKIVDAKKNWPLFQEKFSIRLPEQPKTLGKYVLWLDRFNEVRKKWAHPYGRDYSDEDVQLLRLIREKLEQNLSK